MKLNCVSVKGYEQTEDGPRLCIRAELDEQPSKSWSKLFQLTWLMEPSSRAVPAEIVFSKSDILLFISEAEMVPAAIEALKATIRAVDQKLGDGGQEPSFSMNQDILS